MDKFTPTSNKKDCNSCIEKKKAYFDKVNQEWKAIQSNLNNQSSAKKEVSDMIDEDFWELI